MLPQNASFATQAREGVEKIDRLGILTFTKAHSTIILRKGELKKSISNTQNAKDASEHRLKDAATWYDMLTTE